MTAEEIYNALKEKLGDAVRELKPDVKQPFITADPAKLFDVALFLRDDPEMSFDYCNCVSGVDYNDGNLGAVYHLSSMTKKHSIVVKAIVPKENPHVRSTAEVWGGAVWHEREAYDMVGIVFDGHPDLRRILLPDDYPGHPLRKDFQVPEFYNGMKVPY
jgi:NADH-quinone oxidoreductase subunit C